MQYIKHKSITLITVNIQYIYNLYDVLTYIKSKIIHSLLFLYLDLHTT